jgi:hypothetical protein
MTEPPKLEDLDPVETREWLESIDSVLKTHGPERAHFLLERLIDYTRRSGAYLPFKPNTAYVNSIAAGREPEYPGNRALERRIEAYIRWNALAMVLAANKASSEYGGHLASSSHGILRFWVPTSAAPSAAASRLAASRQPPQDALNLQVCGACRRGSAKRCLAACLDTPIRWPISVQEQPARRASSTNWPISSSAHEANSSLTVRAASTRSSGAPGACWRTVSTSSATLTAATSTT